MNDDFKINTFFCDDGEDLEQILTKFLISILSPKANLS